MPHLHIRVATLAITAIFASFATGAAVADDLKVTAQHDLIQRGNGALQVASIGALVPKAAVGGFVKTFDCTGSIAHQGAEGTRNQTVLFWLGVRADQSVHGAITYVGGTFDLTEVALTGRLDAVHDDGGRFLGGHVVLDWPFADRTREIELGFRLEADRAVDQKFDSGGMIKRRMGRTIYALEARGLRSNVGAKLGTTNGVATVTATCVRNGRLSLISDVG